VDAVDQGGYTALLLAASNNHTAVMAQLLAQGAMIDAKEQTQGYTPLIWAAHRGHRQAVELLLAQGADTTLPDFEGKTAADHAREQGYAEIMSLLKTQ
ncbi:ankyrin repeat domain-containing protein, partial [Halochromatium sp.]